MTSYAPPRLTPLPSGAMPRPRVSIVMPAYRRARFIGATIRSLLAQTFSDFELLVRDDGAPEDGTEAAVAAASEGDSRVRYHRNSPSLRMPGNVNEGIRASRGDYVAICHDHDIFEPDYLATLTTLLDTHAGALFAHCGIEMIDQHDRPLGVRHIGDWPELTPGRRWQELMLRSFSSPVCALSLVRRSAHEAFGLYEPRYGLFADVDLWIRLSAEGDVAYAAKSLIRVRTREEDHPNAVNPWPQLASIFAIHRHHIAERYHGVERYRRALHFYARADVAVVRAVLGEVKQARSLALGASARDLRAHAGPVGRLLAAFAA